MSVARVAAGRALTGASFTLAAAAMIATPLQRRGHRSRLSNAVVAGLTGATLGLTAERWGWRRAGAALGTAAGAGLALEVVGSRTGVPFGRYRYTHRLRPQVAHVPVAVPLAWFAMGVPALTVGRRLARGRAAALGAGAAALTAWDLFLDPQMTAEGYWHWLRRGPYRGIPLSNYAGWLLGSLAVLAALDTVLASGTCAQRTNPTPERGLVGLYAWMAGMSTLGFAVFFRDPLVALVGGVGMGVPAVLAVREVVRSG